MLTECDVHDRFYTQIYTMRNYGNKSNAAVIYMANSLISLQANFKTFQMYSFVFCVFVVVVFPFLSDSVYMTVY